MKGQVHVGCVSEEMPLYLCKSAEEQAKSSEQPGRNDTKATFKQISTTPNKFQILFHINE